MKNNSQRGEKGDDKMSSDKVEWILDNFDWESVIISMKALDWTWADEDCTPNYNELRSRAKSLLEKCEKTGEYVATGGFEATNSDGFLRLAFVVTCMDDYDLDEEADG